MRRPLLLELVNSFYSMRTYLKQSSWNVAHPVGVKQVDSKGDFSTLMKTNLGHDAIAAQLILQLMALEL